MAFPIIYLNLEAMQIFFIKADTKIMRVSKETDNPYYIMANTALSLQIK
jgi:hypothetical protein